MKTKTLIAALACGSAIAGAQSNNTEQKPAASTQVAAPRDAATGKASGRTSGQPAITENKKLTSAQPTITDNKKLTAPSGDQTSPMNLPGNHKDGWNVTDTARGNSGGKGAVGNPGDGVADRKATAGTNAAAADLDGDGKADRKVPSNGSRVATGDVNGDGKADAAINNSHSNIKNGRDLATGQASGKRTNTNGSSGAPQK
jgi:hypothetical protein